MLTINDLHDRVNRMVQLVLFETHLKHCRDDKTINDRQYAIVNEVLRQGENVTMAELQKAPWYQALYSKLTSKTRSRDLKKLVDLKLVTVGDDGNLYPGFIEPLAR